MNSLPRSLRITNIFSRANVASSKLRLCSTPFYNGVGGYKPEICTQGSLVNWANSSFSRQYSDISPKHAGDKEERLKQDDDDNNVGKGNRTLPRLMNFPEIMWPSLLNSIKNWVMVHFIIRPYMDREFNIRDFAYGAKKAMQVISAKLMNGDFSHLGNLVSEEFSIYLTFPYQIGIMFDEENKDMQKRWVEITMYPGVNKEIKTWGSILFL
ncbi:uncharacterized protein [Musca autumnalis]|uniref:uncharacterized protein n=1 Tax=Musca autumnalis TaxID=221902 RepID=UPI003CE9490D